MQAHEDPVMTTILSLWMRTAQFRLIIMVVFTVTAVTLELEEVIKLIRSEQ